MWSQDKWVSLINNSFTGRAQDVFNALDDTQIEDYNFEKKTVLHAYKKDISVVVVRQRNRLMENLSVAKNNFVKNGLKAS